MADQNINIKNRRASYDYELTDTYTAGIQLTGTEIKSIRAGKASLNEAFCIFKKEELYVRNMHIAEYTKGNIYNHDPLRERKLLLKKRELSKLQSKIKEKGLTIIPTRLFISDRGFAKLDIALGKGKKSFDKRESIKQKDTKRELEKALKHKF